MPLLRYILKDGQPVPEPDSMTWGRWFEKGENRVIKQTEKGDIFVSTVFLGLDHNYSGQGEPVLYETMVFGGEYDKDMRRYCTREEALKGHEEMVALCIPA